MELFEHSASELIKLLEEKKTSSKEIVASVYSRIEKTEGKVGAYNTLTKELALESANNADNTSVDRKKHPLHGIPIAIKDNICTKGIKTTCSSKMLENYVPPYNATVTELLLEEGMVPVGKTNMDEFAMGSSTENSAFRTTKNPWDLERVPGGSSGGSAAAVASDEAILALGSDTGGSIRQPASFCSVVGLKPTYGLVSRYGLVAFASSLDQIGPLTKNVTDAALLLNVIAKQDKRDSTSNSPAGQEYTQFLKKDIKGLNIAVPKELMGEGIDKNVLDAFNKALDVYKSLGAKINIVSFPSIEYALAAYYIIAPAEASSNLARYEGVHYGHRTDDAKDLMSMYLNTRREGFGSEVKRRIMIGTYALSSGYYDAYYLKAQKIRTLIKNDFSEILKDNAVIMTPTTPTVPFKIGEKTSDPLSMYLSDIATIPVNLAGVPAISIPAGFDGELPVGLQIIAPHFQEGILLQTAYAYENETQWHKRKPKL